MSASVCYLGDGTLQGAAAYLAAVMLHWGIDFKHIPSHESPPKKFSTETYKSYVLSDYPAERFTAADFTHIIDCVRQGAGLLMIGGWESFFGRLGEYHHSPLADLLPVKMLTSDDRRNCAQPCLMEKVAEHPILDGLPWDRPPGIGGYNEIIPKTDAQTLLAAVRFEVSRQGEAYDFQPADRVPLLVVSSFGRGRTAALATDVAPHWVGGLVDWGDHRVVQPVGDETVEVGNFYAQFLRNLLAWTGNFT